MEFMSAEAAAEEAAAAERRARRKKSPAQVQREAQAHDATKALQEVYRSLAIALHPDLERDPDERARKTELMQRVNVAYEAMDLLALLELQLELEQLDAERVDTIAEARLHHYNRILTEQSRQLAQEIEEVELPYRVELDLPPPARIEPVHVIASIRASADDCRDRIAGAREELPRLADQATLKAWLARAARPASPRREASSPSSRSGTASRTSRTARAPRP